MFDPLFAAADAGAATPAGSLLWLIPGLPLLAALVIGLSGRWLKCHSHWPCVVAIAASFVVSVAVFLNVFGQASAHHDDGHGPHAAPRVVSASLPWVHADAHGPKGADVTFTLQADALTSMMLVMITFIGSFIALYAVGYMHGDPGYPRFFAAVAGFVAAMTILVLGDNFVVLYAGWEGVGLCSYLLIGFWFTKPSAAAAARKAFLVTRLGDVGLFLGILMLWFGTGSLTYDAVFKKLAEGGFSDAYLMGAALLIFCGAAGKSAQFPLHVWLPDAMEGPTPVSALIHAATMVTAGVYLVARCTPLYMLVPAAQLTIACIGGFTALLAALIALTQTDLKRVMAYSTLSQLGYMFLGLGCATMQGSGALSERQGLVTFAVVAAMFHLFTHAFFKALLFLASGSVMLGMGHVIDMRRFSGLRKVMPVTHATFLVGALTLAGFPGLSGFWSKDEILDAAYRASEARGYGHAVYSLLLWSALVTAGLTAFYTFRAYFLTFWGPLRVPAEADEHHGHDDHSHDHAHDHGHGSKKHHHAPRDSAHPKASYESPAVMTVPLVVLAACSVVVGFALAGPFTPGWLSFAHFVENTPGFPTPGKHEYNLRLMALSSVIAVAGIAAAYVFYVLAPGLPGKVAKSLGFFYDLSLNKFYFDEIYHALIVVPLEGLASLAGLADQHGVDGAVNAVGGAPKLLGQAFRPMQNGLVQFYALAMVLGLTVFLLALVRSL
ncbi:MAG: NADH-quinone oxidoreductase subunit L [Gemmataceae bacterium]